MNKPLNEFALKNAYNAFAINNVGGEPVPKYSIDAAIKAYINSVEDIVSQQPLNNKDAGE